MSAKLHLIKLSVGSETPESLAMWQASKAAQTSDGLPCHVTRMWPKRGDEIVDGGSIYWIIKGFIQCRQRVLRLDEVYGQDGIRRCAIVLNPELITTAAVQRRPFQGWRYFAAQDAPPDLPKASKSKENLPVDLANALSDLGLR